MNTYCEKLPLVNLDAPKVASHRSKITSEQARNQDNEDAEKIIGLVGLGLKASSDNKIEAREKYMIETRPDEAKVHSSKKSGTGISKEGLRKPHYTCLYAFDNKLIFQAACCLPLTVIAASLDNDIVSGRILYNTHSEKEGGKLVYEFQGEGSELIIDVKRGNSTRAQRLIFVI